MHRYIRWGLRLNYAANALSASKLSLLEEVGFPPSTGDGLLVSKFSPYMGAVFQPVRVVSSKRFHRESERMPGSKQEPFGGAPRLTRSSTDDFENKDC